jgi:hypothetical protein
MEKLLPSWSHLVLDQTTVLLLLDFGEIDEDIFQTTHGRI